MFLFNNINNSKDDYKTQITGTKRECEYKHRETATEEQNANNDADDINDYFYFRYKTNSFESIMSTLVLYLISSES